MRAATRQVPDSGSEGTYESFADMVLCTVIVLITLVVVPVIYSLLYSVIGWLKTFGKKAKQLYWKPFEKIT